MRAASPCRLGVAQGVAVTGPTLESAGRRRAPGRPLTGPGLAPAESLRMPSGRWTWSGVQAEGAGAGRLKDRLRSIGQGRPAAQGQPPGLRRRDWWRAAHPAVAACILAPHPPVPTVTTGGHCCLPRACRGRDGLPAPQPNPGALGYAQPAVVGAWTTTQAHCADLLVPGTGDPAGLAVWRGVARGWPQCLSPCPPGAAHLDRGFSCWVLPAARAWEVLQGVWGVCQPRGPCAPSLLQGWREALTALTKKVSSVWFPLLRSCEDR